MNLEPILNAFPKKTRVTFVHAISGKLIGVQKMKPEQIPGSFTKPVTITWDGIEWRVMKAEPIHAKDYIIDRKLTLHVQEADSVNLSDTGFTIPTICDDLPPLTDQPVFTDFVLKLPKQKWRQLELLPKSLLAEIQAKMIEVQSILFPEVQINTLTGYKAMFIRNNNPEDLLSISIEEFCRDFNIEKKGSIEFSGSGFIQNGFAFSNSNYIYYGTLKGNEIAELCIEAFESVDEEFCQVASAYDLFLADWCNAKILMV